MDDSPRIPPIDQLHRSDAEVRLIARDEANQAIVKHLALCPLATEQISGRIRYLETRLSLLIGLMAGSGILGGATGALLTAALKTIADKSK